MNFGELPFYEVGCIEKAAYEKNTAPLLPELAFRGNLTTVYEPVYDPRPRTHSATRTIATAKRGNLS